MPLGFGKVVATVIEVVGDSSDVGSLPDVIGATSVVVAFNPSWTSFITPESKRIVNVKPIECSVASDGTLLDPQGAPGVWLLAGEYTVTFTHSHRTGSGGSTHCGTGPGRSGSTPGNIGPPGAGVTAKEM